MKLTQLIVRKCQIKLRKIIKVKIVHQLIREMTGGIQYKKLRKIFKKNNFLKWVQVSNLTNKYHILIKVNFNWIKKWNLIKFQK